MKPDKKLSGIGATAVAALAFSWGVNIAKAIALAGPMIALWRLAIGATVMSGVAVALRHRWPRHPRPVVIAGLAFGLHQILYLLAVQKTSIAIVALLGGCQPLLAALLSQITVGERFSWRMVGWSLLALLSVAIVVHANLDDPSRSLTGDLIAGGNALIYTGYILASKKARLLGVGTLTLTASTLWIALLPVAPVALAIGLVIPKPVDLALLLLLTLGPGSAHLLLNWAHTRTSATVMFLVLLLIPPLSAAWAHLVHGEPFGWRHAVSFCIIAIAIEGGRRSAAPNAAT